jgi:glutathione S-transferase
VDAGSNVPNINPLGKIPVLVLDDETTLFDSRVISEYLDNVAPNNKLMPAPNRERTEVKRWEALADGICDAAALTFLERKRPPSGRTYRLDRPPGSKMIRGLEYMAEQLGEHAWCMGTHFSLADIATGCALGYLAFRFPRDRLEREAPESRPPLRQADAAPGVRGYGAEGVIVIDHHQVRLAGLAPPDHGQLRRFATGRPLPRIGIACHR